MKCNSMAVTAFRRSLIFVYLRESDRAARAYAKLFTDWHIGESLERAHTQTVANSSMDGSVVTLKGHFRFLSSFGGA
jgi:hypothetical protein